MKNSTKKKILIYELLIIIILAGMLYVYPKAKNYINRQQIEKANQETIAEISEEDIIKQSQNKMERPSKIEEEDSENPQETPQEKTPQPTIASQAQAYLEVQFICQAPLQTVENWTHHEESCEEAALLQAYLYETGQTMTKEEANQEVLNMIELQNQIFGGHHDIYADKLKEFAISFYSLTDTQIEIMYDASIQDIKNYISQGHPVIVPITGEILKNPYYPHPGYHMLIVIGYTEDRIITNDNGTRHGADFSYDNSTFEAAMNDAGGDIMILKLY